MTGRLWILGAPDPEMAAIESLLRECGERVEYALDDRGERVTAATAYRCPVPEVPEGATVYAVECLDAVPEGWVRIDHHRPGDPGYGRPPSEFLPASSLGQVIAELSRLGRLPVVWRCQEQGLESAPIGCVKWNPYGPYWHVGITPADASRRLSWGELLYDHSLVLPHVLVLTAAADHCLGAAYRGECPGVDPDALMHWRAESRARFQGRSVGEILADIEATSDALREALGSDPIFLEPTGPECGDPQCSCHLDSIPRVADMRREPPWPELPEASCRTGIGYVAGPLRSPDGRRRITCSGTAEQIRAFLNHWAPV